MPHDIGLNLNIPQKNNCQKIAKDGLGLLSTPRILQLKGTFVNTDEKMLSQ